MQSSRALATKTPERPLSPHLTIYRLPLNAMTSVTFRGCGIAMTVGESQFRNTAELAEISWSMPQICCCTGVGGLAMGLAATGTSMPELVHSIQQAGVGPLARFAVAFPLAFHWGNGLRHMVRKRNNLDESIAFIVCHVADVGEHSRTRNCGS